MKAVVFDVRSPLAHFRRPDTTTTQLTYPFITPLAAKGLVGAIIGITDFQTNDKVGIEIKRPIHTSAQQLSLLGTKPTEFNRPTTQEFIVDAFYRIYYVGNEYVEKLATFLEVNRSVYLTYLGVAFALTRPIYIGTFDVQEVVSNQVLHTPTVVPIPLIQKIHEIENRQYGRTGKFFIEYKGNRTFGKTMDYLYEKTGKGVLFTGKRATDASIVLIGKKPICIV